MADAGKRLREGADKRHVAFLGLSAFWRGAPGGRACGPAAQQVTVFVYCLLAMIALAGICPQEVFTGSELLGSA
eukprot:5468003-Prymnesium_polylepis.1